MTWRPGHGWVTIDEEDGDSTCVGYYPGWYRDDSERRSQEWANAYSWEISDEQAKDVLSVFQDRHYSLLNDNCVDRVEQALDLCGIEHPSFDTMGVSDPKHLFEWLGTLDE